mgnify:FL=1|tara:strand:+ start:128 stop:751 length:624 start_codon:yes stop_codon:yes gene_type:complete
MSQYERNLELLNKRRVVYRRLPITDVPDIENDMYMFFENGTYQCYDLFKSTAKITTYKSLKWHLLVIWYLNPGMDQDEFMDIALDISAKTNGYVSFNVPPNLLNKIVYEVSMLDLVEPPKNKLRKVIFKLHCGLAKDEKLRIVGQLIGRSNKTHPDDVYQAMIDIHDLGQKITIKRISDVLRVSSRTVHRYMCEDLKREKELLNKQL